ncbi:MAG: glycine zipper 2TM domain-containing protein [Gemmatimonadota bacterium]|nr:glycine zipper 2TM domain-containing protein [Gemmatimonadota bacterium]
MTRTFWSATRILTLSGSLLLTPLVARALHAQSTQQPATQQPAPAKHHSKLKGAAAGAVAGHMTHRKHGAVVGAAVGAEVQHHRNKKAAKAKP